MDSKTGHQTRPFMIRSIEIRNFRGYESLSIAKCGRVNVIVGDNGSGKTALLEAIFSALGVTTELALRFRQQRGLEGLFNAPASVIEESIFGDLFFNRDWERTVSVSLNGTGEDNRSLYIVRGSRESSLNLQDNPSGRAYSSAPFMFVWKDAIGNEYPIAPYFTNGMIQFPGTGEDLPRFYYYSSHHTTNSSEVASLFSRLSRTFSEKSFKRLISQEFKLVKDISIEIAGGAAVLHASVPGVREKLPVSLVSGAITRLLGILLTMAARPKGILLVDEMESGVYYSHQREVWSSILSFAKEYEYQIFTTTHSKEWLTAMVEVARPETVPLEDICLWRIEREANRPKLLEFNGKTLRHGIEYGEEPRGRAN